MNVPRADQPPILRLPAGSFWWAGGISLVLLPALALAKRFGVIGDLAAWFAPLNLWLLVAFSFAHFSLTAFWFYRHKSLRSRHPIVAYISPIALAALGFFLLKADESAVSFCFRAGLLFLYWHFAKQSFGASMWMRATPASRRFRQLTLLCCLSIAAFGFAQGQSGAGSSALFRLYVPQLEEAPWASRLFYGVSILLLMACVISALASSAQRLRSLAALIPVVALLTWLDPRFAIAGLATAPIFHGLQALPFALMVDRSRLSRLALVYVSGAAIGWLVADWLPGIIGATNGGDRPAAVWFFLVNVQHFLLESFSWKSNSLAAVKAELKERVGDDGGNESGLRPPQDQKPAASA